MPGPSAHAPPAIPKRNSEGTSTRLRPRRSESTPSTGVSTTPGSVKTVSSSPTLPGERSSSRATSSSAGVITAAPITAIRVTAKMIRRLWFL